MTAPTLVEKLFPNTTNYYGDFTISNVSTSNVTE